MTNFITEIHTTFYAFIVHINFKKTVNTLRIQFSHLMERKGTYQYLYSVNLCKHVHITIENAVVYQTIYFEACFTKKIK